MKKKRIKKIFRPGERVVLKKCYHFKDYSGKVALVLDPPYVLSSRGIPRLNVIWEDGTVEKWIFPGRYFKRAPSKTLMPDTRAYLATMASLDV